MSITYTTTNLPRMKTANIFAFSATTTIKKMLEANANRMGLLIYNNGTDTVYLLSAATGTTSDGIPIAAGASYENDNPQGAYWVIAASGTQDLRIEEDSE